MGSSNAVTQLGWHVEIMWKSKSSKSDQLCAPFHLLAKLNHHTERTEFDLGYHNKKVLLRKLLLVPMLRDLEKTQSLHQVHF